MIERDKGPKQARNNAVPYIMRPLLIMKYIRMLVVVLFLAPLTKCNYLLREYHILPDKWFWADKLMYSWGYSIRSSGPKRYELVHPELSSTKGGLYGPK